MGRVRTVVWRKSLIRGKPALLIAALICSAFAFVLVSGCENVDLKDFIELMAGGGDAIYVSVATGNDDNEGTPISPKKTINAAIQQYLDEARRGEVRVAEGTYEVSYINKTHIVMHDGISLKGGYSKDFRHWDPDVYETIVEDVSLYGGSDVDPNRAIEAGSSVTSATFIEGFTVIGGGDDYTVAFMGMDTAIDIRNNVLIGGYDSVRTFALALTGSSSAVEGNFLDGGYATERTYGLFLNSCPADMVIVDNLIFGNSDSAMSSCGIYMDQSQPYIAYNYIDGGWWAYFTEGIEVYESSPTIDNNIIYGGDSDWGSYGIVSDFGSSPAILNNTIMGGDASEATGVAVGIDHVNSPDAVIRNNLISGGWGSTASYGIRCSDAFASIQNNTIDGGPSGETYGIYYNGPTTPAIQNNIIFPSGGVPNQCIWEQDYPAAVIEYNNLWNMEDDTIILIRAASGNYYTTIGDAEAALAYMTTGTNVNADPGFEDIDGSDDDIFTMMDNDWHLRGNPYTDPSVQWGGATLDFGTDKDDNPRTDLWSMGAYERD